MRISYGPYDEKNIQGNFSNTTFPTVQFLIKVFYLLLILQDALIVKSEELSMKLKNNLIFFLYFCQSYEYSCVKFE